MLFCVALFLGAVPSCFAWDVDVKPTGFMVSRTSVDPTSTTQVTLYYDYKGGDGEGWAASYGPVSGGSYNKNTDISLVPSLINGTATMFYPARSDGGRFQYLYIAGANVSRHAGVFDFRQAVTLPAGQSVAVSTMPSLTLSGALATTSSPLPVTVQSSPSTDVMLVMTAWTVAFGLFFLVGFRAVGG